ncbi:hypothetical protein LZ32DRAFT_593956 [Colletotrichum eremochloae]|nr:hypothetical protein LZ32DRAFT_593956 [Colletotrichum eremochloae]
MLKVRVGAHWLLGRNFFDRNWDGSWKDSWGNMDTLPKLLNFNKPSNPDLSLHYDRIPGLYCVAAEEVALGPSVPHLQHTPENKSSIILLVIWNDLHVSHYLGADAHTPLELRVLDWMNKDGTVDADRPVTSMKLSHHGSFSSNPPQMMTSFSPRNIVVSAGDQYGHPRWEKILIMAMWFRFQRFMDEDVKKQPPRWKPFLPCQWPYFLIRGTNNEFDDTKWSITEFKNDNTETKQWLDAFQIHYNEYRSEHGLAISPDSPAEEYVRWMKNYKDPQTKLPRPPNDDEMRQMICHMIYTLMDEISPLQKAPDPVVIHVTDAVGYQWTQAGLGPAWKAGVQQTVAIVVISAPSDSGWDGRVTIMQRNHEPLVMAMGSGEITYRWPNVNTASAFAVANGNTPRRINVFPDPGEDRPGTWDISERNIPFPKPKTGEVSNMHRAERRKGHQRLESWVAIGRLSDQEESSSGDDEFTSWSRIPSCNNGGGRVKSTIAQRRHIPLHIAASPAVYVASEKLIADGSKFPVGAKVVSLSEGHNMFGLVDTLHYRFFTLSTEPSMEDKVVEAHLADDDQWLIWFRVFCTWNFKDSSQPPPNFTFTMIPAGWPVDDVKKDLEFKLTFDFAGHMLSMSTSAGASSTFSNAKVSAESLKRMLVKRRTIVFGLDPLPAGETLVAKLGRVAQMVTGDATLSRYPLLKQFEDIDLTLDTTKDFRNAIWFRPSIHYRTHMRLQFRPKATGRISEWLGEHLPGLTIDDALVIVRKKSHFRFGAGSDRIETDGGLNFLLQFSIPGLSFDAALTITNTSGALTLTIPRPRTAKEVRAMNQDALGSITTWLCSVLHLDSLDVTEIVERAKAKDGAVDGDTIFPRRMQISLNLDEKSGRIKNVDSVDITLEACLKIGKDPAATLAKKPVLFLLTFGWSRQLGVYLRGNLWSVLPPTPYDEYTRALPEYEPFMELDPLTEPDTENQLRTLDIRHLLSSSNGESLVVPQGIPTEIFRAEIELSKEKISFSGTIRCPAPDPRGINKAKPPPIALHELQLSAGYNWGITDPKDKGFEMCLAIAIQLNPPALGKKKLNPAGEPDDDALKMDRPKLHGMIAYSKGDWLLTADVTSLNVGHLASFWHDDDRSDVMQFLGKINIDYAGLKYTYDAKGAGNKFEFKGQLSLGPTLKLELTYENEGGGKWAFWGTLAAKADLDKDCTIGEVLGALVDTEHLADLPSAVMGAHLGGPRGEKPLRLLCAKQEGMTVFATLIHIGSISLWFVQFCPAGKDRPVKRFIKAAIGKISVDVPVFNATIDSPFEQMFFTWVQDTTHVKESLDGSQDKKLGISKAELAKVKACLIDKAGLQDEDFLLYKTTKDEIPDTETVLAAGSHFVIVAKDLAGKLGVILDYSFGGPKKKPRGEGGKQKALSHETRSKAFVGWNADKEKPSVDPAGAEKGSKAPYKTTLGPLAVENIGLWYKSGPGGDGVIGVTLDATLLMGPIGVALLGFTIGVPLNSKYNLANPPPLNEITWGLQGLVVSLDRPPLTIAGGFMHDTSNPNVDMYAGGLVIGFKPWMFQAMGVYATVTKDSLSKKTTISTSPFGRQLLPSSYHAEDVVAIRDDKPKESEKFTFAFIFCKINGPIFSVGFADFAGLVGGFGMNSDIALPTVEQVVEFPFVAERGSESPETPVDTIKRLLVDGIWFRPAEGLYWAAAGVRVTAFQMLAANIVIVVQFGADLQFGLFGVATCDVPALESKVKFAHVELGIICTVDTNRGVFKLEAQLSPRSFILAPQCHLTGGLAMYSWFKDDTGNNIAAGDWVLTIGGFHQAFRPPPQYPRPPRLGIHWSLDSCLSVTGEAYFAITPKVCMGGGRLHAALSLGALYAWFDTFLDFLINFEPFYFQLQASISVGVRFTLDLWIVTIRINAEVSATLDISGPPFGGVVHVNFWVFGFDVTFGSSTGLPPAVSLKRFWEVVLKSSGSSGLSSMIGTQETASHLLDPWKKHESELDSATDNGKDGDKKKADTAAILLTCESGLEPAPPGAKAGGDDDVWLVRGGSFSFLVTFQFAINKASVVEIRDGKVSDPKTKLVDIKPEHQSIYAKPMQITETLQSEATVLVESTTPKPKDDHRFSIAKDWHTMEWRPEPIVKAVQTSVWGKYNTELDPSRAGNRVTQLLNSDNPTMPLVMGLVVKPPCPGLADDKVNSFNIVQDRMKEVFNAGDKKKYNSYFPSASDNADRAWLPAGKSSSWKDVRKKWEVIGDATPQEAVRVWGLRLGFPVAPLVGTLPKQLLKRFNVMVPALPLVSVGS